VSHDPDHAPVRDDLSSTGWNLLPLTYGPNLKFLTTHHKDVKSGAKFRNFGSLGGQGSLKVMGNVTIRLSAYDLRLSCIIFEI